MLSGSLRNLLLALFCHSELVLRDISFRDMLFAMPRNGLRVFLLLSALIASSCFSARHSWAQSATTPALVSADGSLRLISPSRGTVTILASELKAMPHITVAFHNTHTDAEEMYFGVRLADLLRKLDAPLGSELRGAALSGYIVATGSDGYRAVLALAEVDPSFHPGEVIVADAMNGKPLDEHSGPLKLVVTEDKRPARSVRNLTSIELESLP